MYSKRHTEGRVSDFTSQEGESVLAKSLRAFGYLQLSVVGRLCGGDKTSPLLLSFVIGCVFMTKEAHGGTLMRNCLHPAPLFLDGLN